MNFKKIIGIILVVLAAGNLFIAAAAAGGGADSDLIGRKASIGLLFGIVGVGLLVYKPQNKNSKTNSDTYEGLNTSIIRTQEGSNNPPEFRKPNVQIVETMGSSINSHKYFVAQGDNKKGPYLLDDLKNMTINLQDLIWRKGLNEWVMVKDFDEVRSTIFAEQPPPIPQNINNFNEFGLGVNGKVVPFTFEKLKKSLQGQIYVALPNSRLYADGTNYIFLSTHIRFNEIKHLFPPNFR